jgi:hypothetical protein
MNIVVHTAQDTQEDAILINLTTSTFSTNFMKAQNLPILQSHLSKPWHKI